MYKYSRYALYIKNIVAGIILINIVSTMQYLSFKVIVIIGACVFILINDYLRYKVFYKDYKKNNISIILSFIASILILSTYTEFFFYVVLFEIVVHLRGKIFKALLISHVVIYISTYICNNKKTILIFSIDYWRENGLDFLVGILFYMMIVFVFLYLRVEFKERIKVQNLNHELNEAYNKLREYSSEIEQLTIAKERSRVASEIHDSLGHCWTAIIMHLDFLENIVEKNPQEAKRIILKIQNLARDSMNALREAVYALKDEIYSKELKSSIDQLIENLAMSDNIKINLSFEDIIEDISPNIKHIIYRTIQEGLTNGVKHGKATEFLIDISVIKDVIRLQIEDNGYGCKEIIKGNGLRNIENRISKVHGKVVFKANINDGFSIDIHIPFKGGEIIA